MRSIGVFATVLVIGALSAAVAVALGSGQLDTSFGGGIARLGSDTQLLAAATQSDGKIVAVGATGIAGGNEHLLLLRFTTSGGIDRQVIGPANVIGRAVAVQADGKIVVAGQATDPHGTTMNGMVVQRFNSSGSADGSFGHGLARAFTNDASASANAVALQTDGKVVLAGNAAIRSGANAGFPGVALARFSSNGSLDRSFAHTGSEVTDLGQFSIANGVAVQSDGKIVVGGSQRQGLQSTSALAARFSSSGSLDRSFAGGVFLKQYAVRAAYSAFNAIALQSDGKVVLAGGATNGSSGLDALVVRLTSRGSPDGGFGSGGLARLPAANDAAAANSATTPLGAIGLALSAGRVFTTGWFYNQGAHQLALWGLSGRGAPDGGFGSGGRSLVPGATNMQGNAIAVIPGGKLAVAGTSSRIALVTNYTGFAVRFGGPSVSTKPTISHLTVSPGSFRAASSGATVSYFDSLASQTTFKVVRCGRHGCTSSAGSFSVNDIAGANTFQFTGVVNGRKLAKGSYALQASPKFGRSTGRSASARFSIR